DSNLKRIRNNLKSVWPDCEEVSGYSLPDLCISGLNSAQLVYMLSHEWPRSALWRLPADMCILLLIGTNDINQGTATVDEWFANIKAIVQRVVGLGADKCFVLTPVPFLTVPTAEAARDVSSTLPPPSKRQQRCMVYVSRTAEFVDMKKRLKQLSVENESVHVVDTWKRVFFHLGSTSRPHSECWEWKYKGKTDRRTGKEKDDGIHYSPHGQELVCQEITKVIVGAFTVAE